MARLLIPTRNRPTSLSGVLDFLRTFYPKAEVIVADGSEEHHKALNRAVVEKFRGVPCVDYRPYPYEVPLFERLLDVLRSESDPYFIMGSDDDFPMLDLLDGGERFLRNNPDYSTALGATIHIALQSQTRMTARLGLARQISADTPERRIENYARWMFSTTYAVTRRELLIERYERARTQFLVGFYDFMVGAHDSLVGKIRALPSLGFVGTRNYNHSYLRPEAGLIFLRRAQEVLGLVESLEADLRRHAEMDAAAAAQLSETLFRRRIGELCGNPPHLKLGFKESGLFTNQVVQKQFELFENIFRADNDIRASYEVKLKFISTAVRRSALSEDNKGERIFSETLEDQARSAAIEPDTDSQLLVRNFLAVPRTQPVKDRVDRIGINITLNPEDMLEATVDPGVRDAPD